MKTKSNRKFPSGLIVTAVVVLLALSVTLAGIFTRTVDMDKLFSVSDFNATADLYFMKDSARVEPTTDSYGTLVSLDPNADNYIGNLRADVKYTGCGVGLVRVRIVEEWSVTSGGIRTVKPFSIHVPYEVSAFSGSGNQKAWFDNRANDYRFYYATPLHNLNAGTMTIPLITGLDEDFDVAAIPAGTQLHIVLEADIVQVNRYPQYWDLDTLPWAGATSASGEDVPTA